MKSPPGYRILETIYTGASVVLLRALEEDVGRTVVLKTLILPFPTVADRARFRREYDILSSLDVPGVLRTFGYHDDPIQPAMILEDMRGQSLENAFIDEPCSLQVFFAIAKKAASIIGGVHERSVLHKDIKPSNMIWDQESKKLTLIDFGIASELRREHVGEAIEEHFEGTLSYVAPEQTGRMNRPIDARSDLYSLGATLYFLLVGQPPFVSDDALELIHAHIALKPKSVRVFRPQVSNSLELIIAKLLEKEPGDRYRSVYGLICDLEVSELAWRRGEDDSHFVLGARDVVSTLLLPDRLYGRDRESAELETAFLRAAAGEWRASFVKGLAGVGKSALVKEMGPLLIKRGARLGRGKFDQFRQDIPFSGFAGLIDELVHNLSRDERESFPALLEAWQAACGANLVLISQLTSVLAGHLPDLPPVPALKPLEAHSRLLHTLVRFFKVLAEAAHPLVLFLDDLHWADNSSIALIRQFGLDASTGHVLLIGALRDNEVGVDHAARECIDALCESGVAEELRLEPLELPTVRRFVSDALQAGVDHVRPLADVLYGRAGGNPFFLRTLLADMVSQNALWFSRLESEWRWDLKRLDDRMMAKDVVQFLRNRMAQLSEKTAQVLAAAACVGVSFDLQSVAAAVGVALHEVAAQIAVPIRQELILPLSSAYRILEALGAASPNHDGAFPFRFAHDRLQQAAHGLVSAEEIAVFHFRIGLKLSGPSLADDAVIAVARHLNQGAEAPEASGRDQLFLDINLRAGQRARAAGAFEEAWKFLTIAQERLASVDSASDRELRRRLLADLSETAYLSGRFDVAETCIEELRGLAEGLVELADVCRLQAIQYATIGRMDEAVGVAIEGLAALGLRLSRKPSIVRMSRAFLQIRFSLLGRSDESILAMPDLRAPRDLVFGRLIAQLGVAAYLSGDLDLFALAGLESVRFSLRKGLSPETGDAFTALAIVFAAAFGDLRAAHRFGDLGLALHRRTGDIELKGRIGFLHTMFTLGWNEHRRLLHDRFSESLDDALAAGDILYASFSAAHVHQWNPEWSLERVIVAGERSLAALRAMRSQDVWDSTRVAHQLRLNLRGQTLNRLSLSDDAFDADVCLARMEQTGYRTGVTVYHIVSMQMYFHYGKFELAFEHAQRAESELNTLTGQAWMMEFWTYGGLVAAEVARLSKTRRLGWRFLKRAHKNLSRWAEHCSVNFEHASRLLEAEIWSLRDEREVALTTYERAIDFASAEGFREIEAIAVERLAVHLIRMGRVRLASFWSIEAWRQYLNWGADEKALYLSEIWQDQLTAGDIHPASGATSQGAIGRASTITGRGGIEFDLMSVMKAGQALSGEMEVERLLEKMLRIVMESAGAARGQFFLTRRGHMCFQASAKEGGAEIKILDARPVADWYEDEQAPIPLSVIHAVMDSKRVLLLSDASNTPLTAEDPYIRRHHVKSVLSAPIMSQGRLLAIVYLENREATGVFSEARVDLFEVLASQMSISLENALLYRELVEANSRLELAFEQQRALMQSYHRFVPREFLGLLGKETITDIVLGTHVEENLTVLFSDIRGFTAMSEQMTPQETFSFINTYLSEMEPVIAGYGGFIDKYIGDAIMALFPGDAARGQGRSAENRVSAMTSGSFVPLNLEGSNDETELSASADDGGATAGLEAAVAMCHRLRVFNTARLARGEEAVRIGVGVNTGRIMLGTVGGSNRMDGTVISDAVNVSARIEGLTGSFGVLLLVSDETLSRVKNVDRFQQRYIGQVDIRGKRASVGLHEIFDGEEPGVVALKNSTRGLFEKSVRAFEQGDHGLAREGFEACLRRCPEDGIVQRYLDRIVNTPGVLTLGS